jgi:PiT family inorganic phosphate transporter
MHLFGESVSSGTALLLLLCLGIALSFEFVNGFHDTANAVATVIYTHSLPPVVAVVWSGIMNCLGVFLGGTAVAFSIVHLLPVDLLINIGQSAGILMVLSLLISAIVWNFGTWYFGLPASSSHALIGAILGVGLASSFFSGHGFGSGVNWGKAGEVMLSLLISPIIGFTMAGLLLLISKAIFRNKALYEEPKGKAPPPWWIRGLLFLTCTGVSFAHGSNDGQKGIGLIMLILIGTLPAQYALNTNFNAEDISKTVAVVQQMEGVMGRYAPASGGPLPVQTELAEIRTSLAGKASLTEIPVKGRGAVRSDVLRADKAIDDFVKSQGASLSAEDRKLLTDGRKQLRGITDYVVDWVIIAVALSLGCGTMIGWRRIVVTVGERIGKTHLTYAQGACAELVAMCTIFMADRLGLPVSTTHVLSSGVAGTMAANRSGLQMNTVRNIAAAWILTLPVTMLLAGITFSVTAAGAMSRIGSRASVDQEVQKENRSRVLRNVE